MGYIAVTAFVLNVVVAAILTLILRAAKAPAGVDATQPADYFADEGDPRVAPMPKSVEELAAEARRTTERPHQPAREVRAWRHGVGPGPP